MANNAKKKNEQSYSLHFFFSLNKKRNKVRKIELFFFLVVIVGECGCAECVFVLCACKCIEFLCDCFALVEWNVFVCGVKIQVGNQTMRWILSMKLCTWLKHWNVNIILRLINRMFRNQWIFDSSSCAIGIRFLLEFPLSNKYYCMLNARLYENISMSFSLLRALQTKRIINWADSTRRKVYYLLRLTKSEPSGFFFAVSSRWQLTLLRAQTQCNLWPKIKRYNLFHSRKCHLQN